MIGKVEDTIKRYRLLNKGDRVVIGVSGGPDSVALLYILHGLSKEWKLKLHIAHLDHRLRAGSAQDRESVEALAQRLRLPITCARINIKILAIRGSIEEAARNARLSFLFRVAKKFKADKIALGHNLDDQAETVLMRILRGTGLCGLQAIMPKRNIQRFEIIRPLIETRRSEIEAFLKRKQIKPRRDASNLDEVYLRNKIRHKLIPLLEKEYNKNIKEVLSSLAESAQLDYEYLYSLASLKAKQLKNRIPLDKFLRMNPAVQRMCLRLAIKRIKGDTRRITFRHIKEIEGLIRSRPLNSIVDLPKGISVIKKKNRIFFYRRKAINT
ncbi:MAG: tRNA lysidine(34) synthetase TilS [Candidatus Omnitrophota bacterium]